MTTTGLVFLDEDEDLNFFKLDDPNPYILDALPKAQYPLSVCSSSLGLVLLLDSEQTFIVWNPAIYINDPLDGYREIVRSEEAERFPNPNPAVISLDTSFSPRFPLIYISNPILSGENTYSVDTYCCSRSWKRSEEIRVSAAIDPNTAVSCGRMAYWLTTDGSLIAYDPCRRVFNKEAPRSLPDLQKYDRYNAQLGVLEGHRLACVIVTEDFVNLYLLSENHTTWEEGSYSLCVELDDEAEEDWNGVQDYTDGVIDIECTELPVPVRFETTKKLEIPITVDRKLFIWENDGNNNEATRLRRIDDSVVSVGHLKTSVTITRGNMNI